MAADDSLPPEEPATLFFIGQHGTERTAPVTFDLLSQAYDLGYDYLTTPITTSAFHDKVLELVKEYNARVANQNGVPLPLGPPLTTKDTSLGPEDSNTSLVAIVSPWIDLGSDDPVIAHISRQVFNMELAYAAFCGINNIIIHGPISRSGIVQFGRAVFEGLGLGPYLQLHILLPMTGELEQGHGDAEHLAELAKRLSVKDPESTDEDEQFGVWDTWNTVRTMCNYSHKLSIGKRMQYSLLQCDFIFSNLSSFTRSLMISVSSTATSILLHIDVQLIDTLLQPLNFRDSCQT